jgi:sugar/nucleoside kinase (ribokinase family)
MLSPDIHVIAIGKVGNDSEGKRLLEEMQQAGIDTRFVEVDPENPTMYSVCIQYADKSGFNVTSSNNASGAVTPQYINDCIDSISGGIDSRTIVLAAPEVPVETRIAMLERGKSSGSFCAASILKEESEAFEQLGGFELCDLLSVNEDEAQAISRKKDTDKLEIVKACYNRLAKRNPHIALIVTVGGNGSYCVRNNVIEHIPAKSSAVVNTAGAGDAYIAGVLCGLTLGMPLQYPQGEKNIIRATDFGTLLAGLSVESKHTIAENIDKNDIMSKMQNIMKAG